MTCVDDVAHVGGRLCIDDRVCIDCGAWTKSHACLAGVCFNILVTSFSESSTLSHLCSGRLLVLPLCQGSRGSCHGKTCLL